MSVAVATPPWSALQADGFTLKPWRHAAYVAAVFGCNVESRTFQRGTVHGLLEYEPGDDSLNVVAVHSEARGNGDFLRAVESFERIATQTGRALRVVQFNNRRLAFWFERRAGWIRSRSKRFADHATFLPF